MKASEPNLAHTSAATTCEYLELFVTKIQEANRANESMSMQYASVLRTIYRKESGWIRAVLLPSLAAVIQPARCTPLVGDRQLAWRGHSAGLRT